MIEHRTRKPFPLAPKLATRFGDAFIALKLCLRAGDHLQEKRSFEMADTVPKALR